MKVKSIKKILLIGGLSLSLLLNPLISYAEGDLKLSGKTSEDKRKAEEVNTLVLVSKTTEGRPLEGFEYKLINRETKEIKDIDLSHKSKVKVDLEDGEYLLVQTKRPDGYLEEDEISFSLPYETDRDIKTRQMVINLKHILEAEVEIRKNDAKPKTEDDSTRPAIYLIGGFSLILVASILAISKLEKKKDARKK